MRHFHRIVMFGALCVLGACQDVTAKLPAGTVNPNYYKTPEAAEEMARNARYEFQIALFNFMVDAGRITDELTLLSADLVKLVPDFYSSDIVLDQRHLPDVTLQETEIGDYISSIRSYKRLQHARNISLLARRALVAYAPNAPEALQGELLAYEAFAEVMLADLYCSGIPLSTVDFQGDYTYVPGSSTVAIYTRAVEHFDEAIARASQDVTVQSLARIGKGRALLALGQYAEASDAVSGITAGFTFDMPIVGIVSKTTTNPSGNPWNNATERNRMTVANRKGQIGLPFTESLDPRITPFELGTPRKKERLVVANYVEAQLIRAEGMLHEGSAGWLTALNALRTTCTSTVGCTTPASAGTGGVAGLPPLSDPGSDTARVSLLFRERAFWLFFTGHRQGDLRRLLRHYGRTVETVYPRGEHPGGIAFFDQYVDIPAPSGEKFNPHYRGCLSRGA